MNICYVYSDEKYEWNCSHWRCVIPMRAINKTNGNKAVMISYEDWMSGGPSRRAASLAADVLVVQRVIYVKSIQDILKHKSTGQTVILDLDDAYHYMPPYLSAYKYWIEGKTIGDDKTVHIADYKPIEQLEWGAKVADAVTSPSSLICSDWTDRFGVKTYLVPNYIESEAYPIAQYEPHDVLKMGWGGSGSHFASFVDTKIVEGIRKILKERKDVEMWVMGVPDISKLFKMDGIKSTPHVTINKWPELLSTLDFMVIPLAGMYDRRRSWLKTMECLSVGIPWIANKGEPYESMSKYGTLLKEDSSKSWYNAINEMMENYPERRAKSIENRVDILEYDIDQNVNKILSTYKTIMNGHN